jgi:hypothetical protein
MDVTSRRDPQDTLTRGMLATLMRDLVFAVGAGAAGSVLAGGVARVYTDRLLVVLAVAVVAGAALFAGALSSAARTLETGEPGWGNPGR